MEATPSSSQTSTCWSNVVKNQPPPKPQHQTPTTHANRVFVESCNSTKGIVVAVVDANAIIEGGQNLTKFADKFVTIPEVLSEIRDPVSRRRLSSVPFSIESMEPTPESLNKVIRFARATGDLQTLSDVDLKLIALTYTLEAQIHGTKHLRDAPPPVHTVNVRRLTEKDMPGWGSNVPNLAEWEALEHATEDGSNPNSRILPLKDISLNTIHGGEQSENGSVGTNGEGPSENQEAVEPSTRRSRRHPPQKKEVNIEGKKMVANGIDASQGQFDDSAGDWLPAVSRSTHRRFLRRKARREYYDSLSEKDSQVDLEGCKDGNIVEDNSHTDQPLHQNPVDIHPRNEIAEENKMIEGKNSDERLPLILQKLRQEKDPLKSVQEGIEQDFASAGDEADNSTLVDTNSDNDGTMSVELDEVNALNEELDHLEISSQTNGSVGTSHADDVSSEQSWMLRSLSESSVACVTSDFAMQNVILQIGLRLLAPGGMQIRQLHRWILKCHACYTVTAEIGRIFCPRCGNGGTLRKVAVTVGENGVVLAARRPRITLRGTKFSLPLPQGGRKAITKNLVLREDQLPQKYLYPKTKKKANKQGDDFFSSDDIFIHHTDKRAPLQPPIRKALAVFSGKRNPNDNHYSRSKH